MTPERRAEFERLLDNLTAYAPYGAPMHGNAGDPWAREQEKGYAAARARVLALYAERQGEGTLITEFVVPMPHPDYPNTVTIMLGTTVNPGDRVRVVRVEEDT